MQNLQNGTDPFVGFLEYSIDRNERKGGMKVTKEKNPYATNRGGKITAPHPDVEEVKSAAIKGGEKDLRG